MGDAREPLLQEIRREEIAGLSTIFVGRLVVLGLLALWALTLPFERSASYLIALGSFALLGLLPYLLAKHTKRGFVATAVFISIDVALLTYILIVPPPIYVDGWTPQINLRLPNFLYLGLYLISMGLSYSPWLVLWAGISLTTAWSLGFCWIANLPGTVLSSSRDTLDAGMTPTDVISRFLSPTTVSLTIWYNQIAFLLLGTFILTATVWRSRNLVRKQVAAEIERANLSRYFSPTIARKLADSGSRLDRAEVQSAAVLFADMVGFTKISETLAPRPLVELLSGFHRRLAQAAFSHGGTVDKYIGDAIMVHFGTPTSTGDDARKALECARAMLLEIDAWNVEREKAGEPKVAVGIGVHYGDVITGNIGHSERLEYAVIGDTVNVACRLERLTRHVGSPLVVSDALIGAIRSNGPHPIEVLANLKKDEVRHVRGRRAPVAIWYLKQSTDEGTSSNSAVSAFSQILPVQQGVAEA